MNRTKKSISVENLQEEVMERLNFQSTVQKLLKDGDTKLLPSLMHYASPEQRQKLFQDPGFLAIVGDIITARDGNLLYCLVHNSTKDELTAIFGQNEAHHLLTEAISNGDAKMARSLIRALKGGLLRECNEEPDFRATYQAALQNAAQSAIHENNHQMLVFLMQYADRYQKREVFTAQCFVLDLQNIIKYGKVEVFTIFLRHCREKPHRSLMTEEVLWAVAGDIGLVPHQKILRCFLRHAGIRNWKNVFSNPAYINIVQEAVDLQMANLLYTLFEYASDRQVHHALGHVDIAGAMAKVVGTDNSDMLCALVEFTTGDQRKIVMANINLMATVANTMRKANPRLLLCLMKAARPVERQTIFKGNGYMDTLQKALRSGNEDMFCCLMELTTEEQGSQIYKRLDFADQVTDAVKKGFSGMLRCILGYSNQKEVDQLFAALDLVGLVRVALKDRNVNTLAALLEYSSDERQKYIADNIDFADVVEDAIRNENVKLLSCLQRYGSAELLEDLARRVDLAKHVQNAFDRNHSRLLWSLLKFTKKRQ